MLARSTASILSRTAIAATRAFTTSSPAVLPPLGYAYDALAPTISATIMEIHHTKHHATYVNNLNAALEKAEAAAASGDASSLIALAPAIKFNGGGHINHTLFWENLCPASEYEAPSGDLLAEIEAAFGSFDACKASFAAQTIAVQGSGWGWIGWNKTSKSLEIATCANQDPLQATTGLVPIVGIDVWEHAYYLDYKNVRPDYVGKIFDVINWKCAALRLAAAKA
jgi:Fe-Mn family superoxide dismutase